MGKNKKNKKTEIIGINFGEKSVVGLITNNLTKKGKLQGNSKKETRALKDACPHHSITRKGKIKREYQYNGDTRTCHCKLCGHTWKADVEEIKNVEKNINKVTEYVDQSKLFNIAIGGGDRTQRYLAETSIHLSNLPKVYKKLSSAVIQQDKFNKKKKNDKRNSGSSQYGSWR